MNGTDVLNAVHGILIVTIVTGLAVVLCLISYMIRLVFEGIWQVSYLVWREIKRVYKDARR